MNNKLEEFFSSNKREKIIVIIAIIIVLLLLFIGITVANNVSKSLDDYDMSNVSFDDDSVSYDGSEHSLEISGDLPDGVDVSYTYNEEDVTGVTDIGTYTVVASFQGDTTEYNAISDMNATLTITDGIIDTTNIVFENDSVSYDGSEHSLEISGDLPTGTSVSYTYDEKDVSGVTDVGDYAVVATISGDNYTTKTLTATLTITGAIIDTTNITFGNAYYSYDGEKHSIAISGDLPTGTSVSYKYDGEDVSGVSEIGDYTVVATISGDNYTTKTLTATLTITEKLEYNYIINSDKTTVTLTEYLGSDSEVTVPSSVSINGSSYDVTGLALTFTDTNDIKSVVIPDGVLKIENEAFYYCTGLESVTIPDSVEYIGSESFSNCTSLKSVTIPDSVTTMVEKCFAYCTSLESVTIPNNLETIGPLCFYYCKKLETVEIPSSVTTISQLCFGGCTSLGSITLPDNLLTLGENCFEYCSSLISITIPSTVTSIGSSCFNGCSSLTSISFEDTQNWYTSDTNVNMDVTDTAINVTNLTSGEYSRETWEKIN